MISQNHASYVYPGAEADKNIPVADSVVVENDFNEYQQQQQLFSEPYVEQQQDYTLDQQQYASEQQPPQNFITEQSEQNRLSVDQQGKEPQQVIDVQTDVQQQQQQPLQQHPQQTSQQQTTQASQQSDQLPPLSYQTGNHRGYRGGGNRGSRGGYRGGQGRRDSGGYHHRDREGGSYRGSRGGNNNSGPRNNRGSNNYQGKYFRRLFFSGYYVKMNCSLNFLVS